MKIGSFSESLNETCLPLYTQSKCFEQPQDEEKMVWIEEICLYRLNKVSLIPCLNNV